MGYIGLQWANLFAQDFLLNVPGGGVYVEALW